MSAPLQIRRVRLTVGAACRDCNKLPTGATRERVRVHVATTGHTAEFVIEDTTIYESAGTP